MDVFSNLMVIGECLLDTRRTRALNRAIRETVLPGDVVLDVGTGSGILAMFSAKAGAKKVYAVDIAKDIAKFAKQNVVNNGLQDKVEVLHGDMKDLHFPHKIDVITMELLDTGMVAEQQAVVMNRLHREGIINEKTRLVPYRYQCAIELVEYDFNFYGFTMPFVVQARNFAVIKHIKKKLSRTVVFKDIDFSQPFNTQVDTIAEVEIQVSGNVNALVLKSRTFLSKNYAIWGTTDLNMPVIIPLKGKKVKQGKKIRVSIKYKMAEGFGDFFAEII